MSDMIIDWEESPLADLADIAIGGTPSRDVESYWASDRTNGLPWVAISDLHGRVISETREEITVAGVNNSNVKLVTAGTVLMSFKLSLGRVAFSGRNLYTNEAIAAFKSRGKIMEEFLFYVLPEVVRTTATDIAIKGATLNKESLKVLRIPYPCIPIQKKIVAILTSIDKTIEKTQVLIAKYKQIKSGLMHDLFTRGVLPNGQLRPPRSQVPELYKETEAGWIPREWTVPIIGKVLTKIDAGWSPECHETPPRADEWGVLKVSAVSRGIYDPSESKVLPQEMTPDPSIEVADGDVILTRANGVAELVGVTVLVRNTPTKLMLSDKLLRLVPVHEYMTRDFLALLMQSNLIKFQIDSVMNGSSGQRNISQSQIKNFCCVRPCLDEQERIVISLRAIELKLEREHLMKEKLIQHKRGLMQDLLTGKVPVKVDEPNTEVTA